jgi:hypothetical protein
MKKKKINKCFTSMIKFEIIQSNIDRFKCVFQFLRIMSQDIKSIDQIEQFLKIRNSIYHDDIFFSVLTRKRREKYLFADKFTHENFQ